MSDPLPGPAAATAVELARPASPAVLALADHSPVAAQRLSALEDLVAGFRLSKRSPRTRAAYAADLASRHT